MQQLQLFETFYSFYDHNSPLIFFGGMAFLCLVLAVVKNSRYYTLMFIAFFVLTFKFEYDKHLFAKIKTDMLDLIFPSSARFTKYTLARAFLEIFLPILMDIFGWGLLALTLIFNSPKKKGGEPNERLHKLR